MDKAQIWILDHAIIFSLVVVVVTIFLVIRLHQYAYRISEKSLLKSKIATVVAQLIVSILVGLYLDHVLAMARDRENHRWQLHQDHVTRLQITLRKDSKALSEVAKKVATDGRATDISKPQSDNDRELAALFAPDVMTEDLANHFTEYWEQRQRLRNHIANQDREFRDLLEVLTKALDISPVGEGRRLEISRTILGKCLEKMPGITVELFDDGYTYSILGGGGGSRGGGGRNYLPRPSPDIVAAAAAFDKFKLSPEAILQCEVLKNGADRIHEQASKLSVQANLLAEETSLSGSCRYVRLD